MGHKYQSISFIWLQFECLPSNTNIHVLNASHLEYKSLNMDSCSPVHTLQPCWPSLQCYTHSLQEKTHTHTLVCLWAPLTEYKYTVGCRCVCVYVCVSSISYWCIHQVCPGRGSSTEVYTCHRRGPPHGDDTHTGPERMIDRKITNKEIKKNKTVCWYDQYLFIYLSILVSIFY